MCVLRKPIAIELHFDIFTQKAVFFKIFEKLTLFTLSALFHGCSQRGTEVAHNISSEVQIRTRCELNGRAVRILEQMVAELDSAFFFSIYYDFF